MKIFWTGVHHEHVTNEAKVQSNLRLGELMTNCAYITGELTAVMKTAGYSSADEQ